MLLLPFPFTTNLVVSVEQDFSLHSMPEGIIQLNKRLLSLENLGEKGVKLSFEDGTETVVDLVVGGDGIRSVCKPPSSFQNNP